MSENLPEIVYVKGANNVYIFSSNIILIDENLKEYPLALEEILSHELLHFYYKNSFWKTLKLELNADIRRFDESDKYIQSVKEYRNDMSKRGNNIIGMVNFMRTFYGGFLAALFFLDRIVKWFINLGDKK